MPKARFCGHPPSVWNKPLWTAWEFHRSHYNRYPYPCQRIFMGFPPLPDAAGYFPGLLAYGEGNIRKTQDKNTAALFLYKICSVFMASLALHSHIFRLLYPNQQADGRCQRTQRRAGKPNSKMAAALLKAYSVQPCRQKAANLVRKECNTIKGPSHRLRQKTGGNGRKPASRPLRL